jgi:hypothetical protein
MESLMRKGLWTTIQRIHRGIPGPVGKVVAGQFQGGLADVGTGWPLAPGPTLGVLDAIPVAGLYAFGTIFPRVFRELGLPNDFRRLVESLRKEFGELPDDQLRCRPIPPKVRT